MEKANLTLYTVIGDFSRVAESMRVRFQDVTKMFTPEDDRWMILLQDDTMIRCSMMESGSQADQVAEHTEGMANYFARVDSPLTAIKEEVIRQIQCLIVSWGSSSNWMITKTGRVTSLTRFMTWREM